jgi:hypothetical protein
MDTGFAARWVEALPRRWARNGAILSLLPIAGWAAESWTTAGILAPNVLDRIDAVVFGLPALVLLGSFSLAGLLLGYCARWGLRPRHGQTWADIAKTVTRKWLIGSLLFGLLALAAAVWRDRLALRGIGSSSWTVWGDLLLFVIGWELTFGAAGLVVGLASRLGLRRAIAKHVQAGDHITASVAAPLPSVSGNEPPQPAQKHSFYLVRHWRGDLSLPLSYWLNGWLANIAGALIGVYGAELLSPIKNVPLWATGLSLLWLVLILITLWQLVGIWRSAGKHRGRGGSGFWAGVARFMVIVGSLAFARILVGEAGPQVTEAWQIVLGDPSVGPHELHILRGGTELDYSGGITFGATDQVRQLLDADQQIRAIHLNSQGGRIEEARRLGDLIRSRSLITYTATECASACTIAFLGGTQRFIAPTAKLGFHRGSFPGTTALDMAAENAIDERAMLAAGVPDWFVDRAYSTPSSTVWWPTSLELLRAHFITGIASPEDFAISVLGQHRTPATAELDLLRIPVYVAIRDSEPDTYRKIRDAYTEGVRLGKSEAELRSAVFPYMEPLEVKYMRRAADDAVIEMARVLVDEIDLLAAHDPEACYAYFFPAPSTPTVNPERYLSMEIIDRELAAGSRIIETGIAEPQPIPSEKDVKLILNLVMRRLSARYPATDIAMLSDLRAKWVNHATACRMASALYKEVLDLPINDQAPMLRYLFSRG